MDNLNAQQTINSVLTYYATTDLKLHALIVVGIGAQGASLVGASSDRVKNDENAALAASAIESIESSIVRDRKPLTEALVSSKRPATIDGVLDVLERLSAQAGTD